MSGATFLAIVIIGLAAYFVGFEFATKQGPVGVFARVRKWGEIKARWIGEFMTCPVCMSMLPALLLWAWFWPGAVREFAVYWLASLGFVTFVHFWLWSKI